MRLTVSNDLQRNDQPESHPIYKLYKSEHLAQQLSDYFYQAFGVDLIVNRSEMRTIPLHVGKAPDKDAYTIKSQDEYYNKVLNCLDYKIKVMVCVVLQVFFLIHLHQNTRLH